MANAVLKSQPRRHQSKYSRSSGSSSSSVAANTATAAVKRATRQSEHMYNINHDTITHS